VHAGDEALYRANQWSQFSAGVSEPNKTIQHPMHDLDVRLMGAGSIGRLLAKLHDRLAKNKGC
jgi:lactate dehydrogenase-like 2-hydroxyacid dehydrogenase